MSYVTLTQDSYVHQQPVDMTEPTPELFHLENYYWNDYQAAQQLGAQTIPLHGQTGEIVPSYGSILYNDVLRTLGDTNASSS